MRYLFLSASFLVAACGGGGGGGPPPLATLGGSVRAIAAAPQRLAQREAEPGPDAEPNDFAANARLAREAPRGRVDAADDPVDAFRYVAGAGGRVTAELDADGVDAILVDLETGRAARTLELEAGAVFDVVVSGAGAYAVSLVAGGADLAPRDLPEPYAHCGDGHVPDQLVARTAPGLTPEQVAAAAGLTCLKTDGDVCLLGAPASGEAGEFQALCSVLARCARLEADGLVRYAEPNFRRRLMQTPNDPRFGEQWALPQVRAPLVWDEITATQLIIAVVDSGIRPHPDLVNQLVPGFDWVDDDNDPFDPTPQRAHGTQTAGVACASGDNALGVAGMLWDGRIMPLRAFDTAGFGNSFDIAAAIRFAAGISQTAGADVPASVNNYSFASSIFSATERDATEDAHEAGVVQVAATGNEGSTRLHYPAAYDKVIAVTATDKNEDVTGYSTHGDWVHIAAPGGDASCGVLCPGINGAQQLTYVSVNGTSFASPHVAATAAMMRALDPSLTPDEVRQILVQTAKDIGPVGFDDESGFGLLDSYAAVLAVLGREPPLTPGEEVTVRLLRAGTNEIVVATTTSDATLFEWELKDVAPGQYRLLAGTDRDGDGTILEPGEVGGLWTDPGGDDVFSVAPGQALANLDIVIAPQ